jgi:hypothetical protein
MVRSSPSKTWWRGPDRIRPRLSSSSRPSLGQPDSRAAVDRARRRHRLRDAKRTRRVRQLRPHRGRREAFGRGDLLWLGPPQAAGSVMLQVQFEERDTLPPVAADRTGRRGDGRGDGPGVGGDGRGPPGSRALGTHGASGGVGARRVRCHLEAFDSDRRGTTRGPARGCADTAAALRSNRKPPPEPEPVPPSSSGAMTEPSAGEPSMGDLDPDGPSIAA